MESHWLWDKKDDGIRMNAGVNHPLIPQASVSDSLGVREYEGPVIPFIQSFGFDDQVTNNMSEETKRAIGEHLREYNHMKKQVASYRDVSHKFTLDLADLEMKRSHLESRYIAEHRLSTDLHKSLTTLTEKYTQERSKTLREMNEIKKQAAKLRGLDSNHLASYRRIENDLTKSKEKLEKFQSSHHGGATNSKSSSKNVPIAKSMTIKGGSLGPSKNNNNNVTIKFPSSSNSLGESVLKAHLDKMIQLSHENIELREMIHQVNEQFLMMKEAITCTTTELANKRTSGTINDENDADDGANSELNSTIVLNTSSDKDEIVTHQNKLFHQLKSDFQSQIQDLHTLILSSVKEKEELAIQKEREELLLKEEKETSMKELLKEALQQPEEVKEEEDEKVAEVVTSSGISNNTVAVPCPTCDSYTREMNTMQSSLNQVQEELNYYQDLFTNPTGYINLMAKIQNQNGHDSSLLEGDQSFVFKDNFEALREREEEMELELLEYNKRLTLLSNREKENLKVQEKLDCEKLRLFEGGQGGFTFPLTPQHKNRRLQQPGSMNSIDSKKDHFSSARKNPMNNPTYSPIMLTIPPTPNTEQLLNSLNMGIQLPTQLFPDDE